MLLITLTFPRTYKYSCPPKPHHIDGVIEMIINVLLNSLNLFSSMVQMGFTSTYSHTIQPYPHMQNHSSIVKLIGEHGSLSLNRICHQHALAQPILSPMIYLAPIAPPAVITTLPHYDGHGGNAAFHMAVLGPPGSHNRVTIWPS